LVAVVDHERATALALVNDKVNREHSVRLAQKSRLS
jgi:hypothetical protein